MNKDLIYIVLTLIHLNLSIGFSQQRNDSINKKLYTVSLPLFRVKGGYQIEIERNSQNELINFIRSNIKLPETAVFDEIDGKVIIQYTVTKTGEVSNVKVLRGLRPDLDEEALRVIKLVPKWDKPGIQNGIPVNVTMTIPIRFYNNKKLIGLEKRKRNK